MAGYTVTREHEICCGHRVYGHESCCKYIHGHQYKFEMTIGSYSLDDLGRVIDFSVMKAILCRWLEENWDHKLLLWKEDPVADYLYRAPFPELQMSVVKLPCNPTVENIAEHFVEAIAPGLLLGKGVDLISVRLWETSKCSTTYIRKAYDDKISFGDRRKNMEKSVKGIEEKPLVEEGV